MSNYDFVLYITGNNVRSQQAIANLKRLCETELAGRYELTIVDVLVDPQRAEDEKIVATPTLIKRSPPPVRRIIGDLADISKVLLGLDLLL